MSYKYKAIKVNGKKHDLHRYLMEQHLGCKLSRNEVVHHINGDKYDNRIENLEVQSRSQHSRNHMIGTHLKEESLAKLRKITLEEAKEIKKSKGKISCYRLAEKFNVSRSCISDIWEGRTWKML